MWSQHPALGGGLNASGLVYTLSDVFPLCLAPDTMQSLPAAVDQFRVTYLSHWS